MQSTSAVMTWCRRVLLVVLATLVLAWPGDERAGAHASLLGSDPSYAAVLQEAPTQVQLRFDNPVEPGLVKARLRDADGNEVAKAELIGDRNARPIVELQLPEHGPGEWSIAWVTFAFDGHVVSGTIPYTVDPDATPSTGQTGPQVGQDTAFDTGGTNALIDVIDIQVRFVSYLALAAAMGAALWLWLTRSVQSTAGNLLQKTARRTLPVAAVAAAVALLARLAVALWRLFDGGFAAGDLVPLLWSGQLTIVLPAAAMALFAGTPEHPVRSAALLALAAALPATAGHAGSYAAPGVGAGLIALHVAAAVVWVGVVALFAYVAADKSFAADPERWSSLRPALDRLARLLWVGFVTLVVTGIRSAVVFADGMPEGRWGMTLAAKVILVAVAAAIGGFHYLRGRRGQGLSAATLAIEAAALCLALTAAAVLTVTVPT